MRMIDSDEYKKKLYAMMPEFDEENDKKCIEGQTIFFCIATLDDMPTITPPPNDTLTLEELREMDGEPVWVTPAKEGGKILKRWMLLECFSEDIDLFLFRPSCGIAQGYTGAGYGKIWLAYRRKLEEGTT